VIVVRWADDFAVGFERRDDAERFWGDLRERLAEFGLRLADKKTRLIEFGRFAARDRKARGLPKPDSFDFPGLTHVCGTARKTGRFALKRVTSKKRLRAKLRAVKTELVHRRHDPIPDQGQWLASVVRRSLRLLRRARQHRRQALRRRSQRTSLTWERMYRRDARWIPTAGIVHPWPTARFDARTRGKSPAR